VQLVEIDAVGLQLAQGNFEVFRRALRGPLCGLGGDDRGIPTGFKAAPIFSSLVGYMLAVSKKVIPRSKQQRTTSTASSCPSGMMGMPPNPIRETSSPVAPS